MSDPHRNPKPQPTRPNPQPSNPRPTRDSPSPHRLPEHIEPSNPWSRPTPPPRERR